MKYFIKDKDRDLRSPFNFIITKETDTEIVGQLLKDTQFSLFCQYGDSVTLSISIKENKEIIEEYVFEHEVLEDNPTQIYEYPTKKVALVMNFAQKEYKNGVMVYCPIFRILK